MLHHLLCTVELRNKLFDLASLEGLKSCQENYVNMSITGMQFLVTQYDRAKTSWPEMPYYVL